MVAGDRLCAIRNTTIKVGLQSKETIVKRLNMFFLVVFVLPVRSLWADCLGCCSGHGGVVCVEGVTR